LRLEQLDVAASSSQAKAPKETWVCTVDESKLNIVAHCDLAISSGKLGGKVIDDHSYYVYRKTPVLMTRLIIS
jgi:hypothetical protein